MRTGLVSISFRGLRPEEIIPLTAQCGLESIEWGGDVHVPCGDLTRARAVGRMTRDAGLEVACYGSYCRLTDGEPSEAVADTAAALGAPLLRVWAGALPSREAGSAYRAMVVRNAGALMRLAGERGMALAFEYHGGTLTDDADSARALLDALLGAGCLWQPPVGMDIAGCLAGLRAVGTRLKNVHVFSWADDGRRLPLADGAEKWRACLEVIGRTPGERRLLLEFVQNDDPAQLRADADCLRRWLRGDFS